MIRAAIISAVIAATAATSGCANLTPEQNAALGGAVLGGLAVAGAVAAGVAATRHPVYVAPVYVRPVYCNRYGYCR